MPKKGGRRLQMQKSTKPQPKLDWGDLPILSVENFGYQLMEQHVDENWLQIATFASQYHYGYGRGAVLISEEGKPEDYVTEDEIESNDPLLQVLRKYDPLASVVVLYQIAEDSYVFDIFTKNPSPSEAEQISHIKPYREDYVLRDLNQPRPIRWAEVQQIEEVIELAYKVVQALNGNIPEPRHEVLRLAIKLIAHAKTIYRLSQEPTLLVPRLDGTRPIVDIGSIASVLRIALETYLTMHEVFFEPKSDDEFDYYYSRWILNGIEELKKRTDPAQYQALASEVAEPLRLSALNRLQKTSIYHQMFQQKKQDQERTIKALIHRHKDDSEWERIAKSAGISTNQFRQLYTGYSGFVHSDGYTALQLDRLVENKIDINTDFMLYFTMALVAKMTADLVARYEIARSTAEGVADTFRFIKNLERKMGDV